MTGETPRGVHQLGMLVLMSLPTPATIRESNMPLDRAKKAQLPRAQRLCNLASYSSIKYVLPADLNTLKTSRVGMFRVYWVKGVVGSKFEIWYGLAADNGSYRGFWPDDDTWRELEGLPAR